MAVQHRIVYPDGFTIPDEAARIHGITTETARSQGIPLQDVLEELNEDLGAYGPELYVGHNVTFDRPIVLAEFSRAGMAEEFCRSFAQ